MRHPSFLRISRNVCVTHRQNKEDRLKGGSISNLFFKWLAGFLFFEKTSSGKAPGAKIMTALECRVRETRIVRMITNGHEWELLRSLKGRTSQKVKVKSEIKSNRGYLI